MSRKYKFHHKSGLYFVSFATVHWISVFIRQLYFDCLSETLEYSRKYKGMEIFGYCIMPNHIHLIFRALNNDPAEVLREYKMYTARSILQLMRENPKESRKEWILSMMRKAASTNSQPRTYQFWQHHSKPIHLWLNHLMAQKLKYIHMNPVVAGFVKEPWHWKYSSASNYAGEGGIIDISLLSLRL